MKAETSTLLQGTPSEGDHRRTAPPMRAVDGGHSEGLIAPLAPSLRLRRLQIYVLLMLTDAAVILAAFNLVGFLYFGEWFEPSAMLEAQLVLPVYWTLAIYNSGYAADAALNARTGAMRAITAVVLAVVAVVLIAFYLKAAENFSRAVSAGGTLGCAIGLAIARDWLSGLAVWRCGPTATNTLVITDGGPERTVSHALTIDARACGLVPDISDPHALHRIALYLRNMDRVVVSCAPERRRDWALVLKGSAVQGEIVDDDIHALGAVGAYRTPDYASLIIARGPLRLTNQVLKRIIDLAIAGLALVLLAPVMLAAALAI